MVCTPRELSAGAEAPRERHHAAARHVRRRHQPARGRTRLDQEVARDGREEGVPQQRRTCRLGFACVTHRHHKPAQHAQHALHPFHPEARHDASPTPHRLSATSRQNAWPNERVEACFRALVPATGDAVPANTSHAWPKKRALTCKQADGPRKTHTLGRGDDHVGYTHI